MKPRHFNRFLAAAVFTMTAAANAASVTWNTTNGDWDTVTSNWDVGLYTNGDAATFDQAAGGTVTLVGTIAPLSTTVSAASGTYTFQGAGITAGTLNKSGAGTLVLSNGNTYTGATTISGGTLKVTDPVVTLPVISDMSVHLDASQIVAADGSNVSTWTNLAAGGAGNFTVTAGTAPTYVASGNTMNGRPAVRFNNSAMLTNATVTGTNKTIIFVGRLNGGSDRRLVGGISNNWLFGFHGGTQDDAHFNAWLKDGTAAADHASHVYSGTIDAAGSSAFYANGNLLAGPTGSFQGPNGLALGGYGTGGGGEQSYGEIGELLVFNKVLSAAERVQVENYLQAKWNGAVSAQSAVNLTASGATFDANGANPTLGSLAGVAGSQVLINGGDLTVGNLNTLTTFSGVIADGATSGGSFIKTGNGDLILAGDSTNTFTGTTTLMSGRIGLAKTGGAYPISGPLVLLNSASPDLYTLVDNQFAPGTVMQFTQNYGEHVRFELLGTTQTLAGLENPGTVGRGIVQHREQATTATAVDGLSDLILNGTGTYTFDGFLRGNGGALALTKTGSGTQILSGANITYNGGTNVNSGTLQFEGANKGISGGMVLNGGTLNHNGTGYLTVGGVLNVAVNSTINVNTTTASRNLFFDSGISGSGNLIINSTGDAFTGVHFRNGTPGLFSGNLTVNDGHFASQGNGFNFQNSNVTLNNTTWYMNGSQFATTAANEQVGSLSGNGHMEIGAQALTLGTFNKSGSLSGNITGTTGSLTKTGSGTQTLSGTVSYTGATTVNGGILNLTGTATLGGAASVSGGTLSLTGTATIAGATTVSGGTLNLDYTVHDNSKLADGAILTLAGGTLNLNGGTHPEFVSSVILNAGASKITRTAGAATLDMGPITRNAGATLNLSEDYIAFTTNGLVDGILGTWATVGSGASTRFATTDGGGYIIGLTGTSATTVNDFVDAFENYEYSLSGGTDTQTDHRTANTVRYSGSGETIDLDTFNLSIKTLLNAGTGNLTLTRSGPTGSLLASNLLLDGANSGIVASAPITGTNVITAGNVTLSGTNSYTGSTTVTGGSLVAGSATALGSSTAVTVNSGVLDINGQALVLGSLAGDALGTVTNDGAATVLTLGNTSTTTFAGVVENGAGVLALTKVGTGTQILSGPCTYTGTTTINAGTLQIGAGGMTGTLAPGSVVNNATLRFHRAGNLTVANDISGTGNIGLFNSASGNLTFTGSITCNNLNFDRPGSGASVITLSGSSPNVTNSFTSSQDGHGNLLLAKDAGVNALAGTVYVGNGYASQVRVMLGNNEQIANDSIVSMGGSGGGHGGRAWFDLMSYSETIAGLADGTSQSYVRNMGVNASTLTLAGSGTYVMGSGNIQDGSTGMLNIVKSGSGTQTLAGNGIDQRGSMAVNLGRLILLNNDDIWSSQVSIASGAVVEINRNNAAEYEHRNAFTLSGAGTLEKTGNGVMYMNWDLGCTVAMNSGSHIHVKEGQLRLGYGALANWTNNKADLTVAAGATFDLWDNNNTTAGLVVDSLNGGGSLVRSNYAQTGYVTIGVDGGDGHFSGVITNASGTTRIIKNGSGTQMFSGVNTYTGGTEVNGGVLVAAKSTSIGTNGGLKLNGGSFVYQPSTAGALALGSGVLNLANGSVLGVAIGGTLGQSAITSSAAAVTTGSTVLNISGVPGTPANNGTHALITAASGLSGASYSIGTVVNPTSFTLGALSVTDTAVSLAVNGVTPLTAAFWKGGFGDPSSNNVWALSDGTSTSNWASDGTGTATSLVPGATSVVNFSATGATNQASTVLGANMNVAGIVVNDASGIALNPDDYILTLGNQGVLVNNGTLTLGAALTLGDVQSWTNDSGQPVGLTVAGPVDRAGFNLTFGGSGFTLLSGPLSGAGGLFKTGSGTLALAGANPYAGTIAVNGGTLKVAAATALGGTSIINIADAAGAGLDITGFNTTLGSVVGGGSTGGGIQLGAATLTTGGLNTADTFSGTVTGSGGGLTKVGTAALTLAGPGNNTYTGTTTVSQGILNLAKTGGAKAISGNLLMNGPDQTFVRTQQPDQLGSGVVANMTTGSNSWNRFEFFGKDQTLAGINTGTSTTQGGGIFQNSEANGAAGAPATLTLNGSGNYLFNGHVRDYGGNVAGTHPLSVIKSGTGTQTLLGNVIAFSGNLTINGGKVNGNRFGLNSNSRTITVNSTGTLEFSAGNVFGGHNTTNSPSLVINAGGTVTNAAPATNNALRNVTLNGGTLTSTVASDSELDRGYESYGAWGINGIVTSTGSSTITTAAASDGYLLLNSTGTSTTFNVTDGTLTVSAQLIDGERGTTPSQYATNLIKDGAGTLTFSAVNTYTGNTTVNGGTLNLTSTGSLKFVIGATSGTNNSLSGAGAATLDGTFDIDTTLLDASALTGGSWQLENVAALTGAYGTNFKVVSGATEWTATGDKWTTTVGDRTYTFNETTGRVSFGGYDSWLGEYPFNGGDDTTRTGDPDNDGFTNLQEFLFGTDPTVGNGSLTTTERSGGDLIIRWTQRTSGATYALKESATLGDDWLPSAAPVSDDGAPTGDYQPRKATVTIGAGNDFFRVEGVEEN